MTSFLIAETFTDSLAKLTGDEQKAVKTTAFDLQMNPASPGLSLHKLDKAKDKRFWSVRASSDIRLIVHRMDDSLMLCYVDHHDKAYAWAERRKLEVHPKTGAAQIVEIRERVQEIAVPVFVKKETPAPEKPRLFGSQSDDALLGYGVPAEWLADVRAATDDTILELADHLPREAGEALLDLATGVEPRPTPVAHAETTDPFTHPDAQRRFRMVENIAELDQALEFPWDKWTIFLHPAQRALVERQTTGPSRVSGSAGTGKTIVAVHRAVFLAKADPDARVLLTTFSDPLAAALRMRVRRLIASSPSLGDRIDVDALDTVALRLYERTIGRAKLATESDIESVIRKAAIELGTGKFTPGFLITEWRQVIDARQIESWEQYRDVERLGRKTRLSEQQREGLWRVFERTSAVLRDKGLMTIAAVYAALAERFGATKVKPFDYIVVDEAQDISVPQMRFLAALGGTHPNGLFFAGDTGQRILQLPFSWRQLGVDIRGRSTTLRVNYRTSHQIRTEADRLLDSVTRDVDGNEESRSAVSVFNGPKPRVAKFFSTNEEEGAVAAWLRERLAEGIVPGELAVFVRSDDQLPRARSALEQAGLRFRLLDGRAETSSALATLATMHLAKGLEFRAVAVMACDDEVLPLQSRIEAVTDESDLEDVYATERQLLYVACTRARDALMVSGVEPASEFLEDLVR